MKKLLPVFVIFVVARALAGPAPGTATADIVAAANAFISSLTPEQRQKVMFAFDDAAQRVRWSNFPTGFVPRAGISLKQMDTAQRAAAERLLSTVLSPMGLSKVNDIRRADDDFKVNGSRRGPPGGGGPPPSASESPGGPPGAPPGKPRGLGGTPPRSMSMILRHEGRFI